MSIPVTHKSVLVQVHTNGVIRIYADGGILHEIKAEYIKVETYVDPQLPVVSGTVHKVKS